jgi:hypothetical protein
VTPENLYALLDLIGMQHRMILALQAEIETLRAAESDDET